jgi:hypothetical protein
VVIEDDDQNDACPSTSGGVGGGVRICDGVGVRFHGVCTITWMAMVTDCSLDCSDEGRAAAVGARGPHAVSLGGDLGDRKRCRQDHSGGGSRCDYISTNRHESARQDLNNFELCVLLHRQLERDFRVWLDCRKPMIGSGLENNNDAQ